MCTREEFQSLYGPVSDAVFALVTTLKDANEALATRVKQLEDQLGKDSHNSSKSPSSDPLHKKTTSQRKPSGRKQGGQHGHPGRTLAFSEHPDHFVAHPPTTCAGCGACLDSVVAVDEEKRQVFDLPPLKLEVSEHRLQSKVCPGCGHKTCGEFPEDVLAPVQYGPRVRATAVYLADYQLLPMARIAELFADVFGTPLSSSTVVESLRVAATRLKPVVEEIRDALIVAKVAHFDESGLRVGARLSWLHSASTARLTYYFCHRSRGRAGMDAAGVLPSFTGQAMHDGWKPYRHYGCAHRLCNSHHLRELTALYEQQGQEWAKTMRSLLGTIKTAVDAAKEAGHTRVHPLKRAYFLGRYRRLLRQGYAANPPPARVSGSKRRPKQSVGRNLLERLDTYQEDVLAFMNDFSVPFDNNQAERDVRMVKVKQKVSGGFRTDEGAEAFCRIRSYLSTLRKQGQSVLTALEHVFRGTPIQPDLSS